MLITQTSAKWFFDRARMKNNRSKLAIIQTIYYIFVYWFGVL